MLLLHLSDIHFKEDISGRALDPNEALRHELLRDIASQCKIINEQPEAILITGDISFAGSRKEFEIAQDWLEILCTRCGSDLSKIVVVPGNHDAVRDIAKSQTIQSLHSNIKYTDKASLASYITQLLLDQEASKALYRSLENYNDFASRFLCSMSPPERTTVSRDLTLNDGSILRISGFNSSFVSSHTDKEGDLFVDDSCFQLKRENNIVHLTMCHHPFSWLRQGRLLKDFLDSTAHLQLFGHEHTNRIDLAKDYVRIFASAAQPDKEEEGWEPGYNLIQLKVNGNNSDRKLNIRVHVRVWQKTPGIFRAKVDTHGSNVFEQDIPLPPWTSPQQSIQCITCSEVTPANTVMTEMPVIPEETDAMQTLREISVRFFKLSLNQKAEIAGRLNLLEDSDTKLPDYERFRIALLRAKERGQIPELDRMISEILGRS